MIKWYKKYVNYIVGCLFSMLCLKSCNMNRMERWHEQELSKNECIIDSLEQIISSLGDSIYIYNINKDAMMQRLSDLEDQIKDLKTSNKHFQRTQNTLINTNKNLLEQK